MQKAEDIQRVSLIQITVSMRDSLRKLEEIAINFKITSALPLLELLKCSFKDFHVYNVSYSRVPLAELSQGKIVFFFSLNEKETGYILLDKSAPANLIDLYYGGSGDVEFVAGSITSAERLLVRDVVEDLLANWAKAWEPWVEIHPELHLLRTPAREDNCPQLICYFKYQIENYSGDLYIAMPAFAVSAAIYDKQQLNNSDFCSTANVRSNVQQRLSKSIMNIPVCVHGELARQWLPVKRIEGIQVGDFIPVEWPDRALIKVDGCSLFAANPSVQRGQLVLEVTGKMHQVL